jgi:tetratricopeptide (TPR) repeat protein
MAHNIMLRRVTCLWCLFIFFIYLGDGDLLAQVSDSPQADRVERLVREGVELRRMGNDDAALSKFEAAYKIAPTPRHAAQLGLCQQALGRWSEAEKHLSAAIQHREDPWVAKNLATLRDSLEAAKSNVARLELIGGPPGATVTVNGIEYGQLPLSAPIKVNSGQVYVVVIAPQHARWTSNLTIAGGHYQRVVVEMIPEPSPSRAKLLASSDSKQPLPATTDNLVEPAHLASHTAPKEKDSPKVWGKWWFWAGVGSVLAGAVATAIVLSSNGGGEPSCPAGVDVCAARP